MIPAILVHFFGSLVKWAPCFPQTTESSGCLIDQWQVPFRLMGRVVVQTVIILPVAFV
jgi:hypothetical protein